jgi:diguanylate cyclase (GGDEF)-like protein
VKYFLDTCGRAAGQLPGWWRQLRKRDSKRGLVNEILTIQLVSAALAGSLAVAGLYWGGQWVLKDNYARWALQWTNELNELAAPLYLTDDEEAAIRLESYVDRFPEIRGVDYYDKSGEVIFSVAGVDGETPRDALSDAQLADASAVMGAETSFVMHGGVINAREFQILAPVWVESLPAGSLFGDNPLDLETQATVELLGFIGLDLDFKVFHDGLLSNMRDAVLVLLLLLAALGIYGRHVLRKALKSVSDLEQPIRDIALGDLDVNFKPAVHREISDVVDALQTTVAALSDRDARLRQLANRDSLTGLFNRRRFVEALKQESIRVMREGHESALLFIDLDQFKYINDACGHPAGDRLICKVADELTRCVGEENIVARFGGDEFVVLARCSDQAMTELTADRILQAMRRMAHVEDGRVFYAHCSIGITAINPANFYHDDLIQQADLACREAKLSGRNRFSVFDATESAERRKNADVSWVTSLRDALDEDRFKLRFQPINRIDTGETVHHEVLIRLIGDNGELVAPDAFLPSAARFGLMAEIDLWVIRHAARAYSEHSQSVSELKLAINLSAHAFESNNLTEYVREVFEEYSVPPANIIFEITESLAIRRPLHVDQQIKMLRKFGVAFALDDFGTGYSSFGYLQQLKFDYLKIDGTFVRDLPKNPVDQKMIRLIAEVGQEAGMETVAEYVQDAETLNLLAELGIDMVQGHFVGEAVDAPKDISTPIALDTHRLRKRRS